MKHIANAILIFFLISSNISCGPDKKTDASLLTPQELSAKKSEVILIDVRTPEEFASGHIEDAVNINIFDQNFKTNLESIDKKKPVSVYCKVGGRSAKAADIMREMGFEEVYDLKGGIRNWEKPGWKL
jgi:rhodanese-related sulfurtransferase